MRYLVVHPMVFLLTDGGEYQILVPIDLGKAQQLFEILNGQREPEGCETVPIIEVERVELSIREVSDVRPGE